MKKVEVEELSREMVLFFLGNGMSPSQPREDEAMLG